MVGWGFSEKKSVCEYKQTLIFKVFFYWIKRFREKKSGIKLWQYFVELCSFLRSYFFFSSETATAQPFPYFIFLHIVACFLFFFISQSNFWGFFRAIKSFWLLLFFYRREIGLESLEPSTFFLGCQKVREHISF